ncbi:carbohydrate-binding module family 18 protein [Naviculisporaceae sp. PSN 640]
MGRSSALVRGILFLALGFTAQVNAQCSRSIEAHEGDTCATLAALTGITVSQFLKSNPSVTSCAALTPGRTYCVEGTAPAASGTTSAVPTSGPLQVSKDGTCGAGVTCKGSGFGNCCSKHGFCGSTSDYCGDGCQPSLGTCGTDPGQPSNPITSPPAATRTSTVTVTSTATTTSTAIVTSTRVSIVLQTSTVVVTSATLTTIKTVSVTAVNTIGCGGGGLVTTIWQTSGRPTPTIVITTRIPGGPSQPRPTPYLPGSSNKCRSYDQIQQGDTCRQLANRNGVSLLDFYELNPSVSANKPLLGSLLCTVELLLSGLCQIDCDNLWTGYFVCVSE